ncbi:hypothetical protein [Paracoccus saliphilus]|uniref:Lipoprotein n=1 Tax=Paracoccus saliphilus TaxID=405559 RepID=A0AA45W379_9RHOB|nr:hypothetical protein [Paracoccus saliphilus]WCR04868.1 hypothetical protein JHX88_09240 [Paracoccus saliphilus]SIS73346.1 hypothetical protein SAMN05421772_103357 [Paracoccus saliphilus]
MLTRGMMVLGVVLLAGCVEESEPVAEISSGIYDLNPDGCGEELSLTRLTVSGDNFRFYESACRMEPVGPGPDGLQARLICTGEGESFERRVNLRADGDFLDMMEDGERRRYHRCPV